MLVAYDLLASLLLLLEFLLEDLETGMTVSASDIAKASNTTKGRGKAREEDEKEEFEWQKALTVVDTGMGVSVVLKKAKGKTMVLLEEKKALKKSKEHATTAEQRMTQRGAGTLLAPNPAIVVIAKKKGAHTEEGH
ncbi:hypothetical protein C0989_004616 [Termitomyces sp. Mn162]|nr:hypothetical protein C0989_004616 [Termitomyces sp. Mn162]